LKTIHLNSRHHSTQLTYHRFHPVFLGGINVGSGNKPPWTLPAKAALSKYDLKRTIAHFGTEQLSSPPFFPILSVVPQRAISVVQSRHDRETFERCWLDTWRYSFITHIDISKPEGLAKLLGEHFDDKEVKEIMRLMGTKEYKDRLTANTKEALDRGAFGAPWFWMTNDQGVSEPLFGSDRWTYMWRFLGVEFEEMKIKDKSQTSAKL
jgi:glutathione S-transferase kappa 1